LAACASCGSELRPGAAFCASCGSAATPAPTTCAVCGEKTDDPQGYCSYCGSPPAGAQTPPPPPPGPVPWTPIAAALGPPGVGIAGFVLSLLGFSVLGIILSWVGLSQAKREGRPTGLCVAGIVIGFIWLAISIILTIVVLTAASSATQYYE
jgi:hypothetical protein